MSYGFDVEIKGRYACFSRPELKVERVSYDVMTPSAARGILEAVMWKPAIRYVIDEIIVCAPIKYENIRRNEVNSKIPYKNERTAAKELSENRLYLSASNDRAQRATIVLKDVCYVVSAHFEMTDRAGPDDNEGKFTEMIRRRLRRGQNFNTPYLGVREFPAEVRLLENGEKPAPINDTRSFGLMFYDFNYELKSEMNFNPVYFMAEMTNGRIDLRNSEVFG